jgi:sulfur carrier protein ThiS
VRPSAPAERINSLEGLNRSMTVIELTVEVDRQERVLQFPEEATVGSVLDSLGLFPDAHIVVRGKTPVPLDAPVVQGDRLRVIKVASGG